MRGHTSTISGPRLKPKSIRRAGGLFALITLLLLPGNAWLSTPSHAAAFVALVAPYVSKVDEMIRIEVIADGSQLYPLSKDEKAKGAVHYLPWLTSSQRAKVAGTLSGRVVDQLGGAIVGSIVTVNDSSGLVKTVKTNGEGIYVFGELVPGAYTVRAIAPGFAPFERPGVDVPAGRSELLNIMLDVSPKRERVTIKEKPRTNLSAIVLRGEAIRALPVGPGGLLAALQALARPSAGPHRVQILVDGFSGGRIPPRESIREIRINENSFSAEFDKPSGGRIEIFTKPGSDNFNGNTYFNFNDESLNSRNPYAPNRAPYQSRLYGGNLSGPIISKRASFFLDFERQAIDNNAVINATILDPTLHITPYNLAVLTPQRRTTFSPRFDYQLDANNSLVARYSYTSASSRNAGVGDFSLLSQAYASSNKQQTVQLTETDVLSQRVINETRLQYIRERSVDEGNNSVPTILVQQAFVGGGPEIGLSFNNEDRWELQNYTSWSLGPHFMKAGGQLRSVRLIDSKSENFGGTFTFAGGFAPQLVAANQVLRDASGQPVIVSISSLERYRRTLLFQRQGLTPPAIRALGGGATQFSIAGGNPLARVGQYDLGAFVQDDWLLRPNFTLSLGLRYEIQNNISSNLDLAPRIAFAWSPGGGANQSKTVIRGGFGIFYDRFSENFTLQARRSNGINQKEFIVSEPEILDSFNDVPSVEELTTFAIPQSTVRVAHDLSAPYTMESSVSIERQLPFGFTLSGTFENTRTLHVLRSRDVNAPVPATFPDLPENAVRPLGNAGEIFQYETSGVFNQKQLMLTVSKSGGKKATFYTTYLWNKARSDTDGAGSFPASAYDLRGEYGRSAVDSRHSFYVGAWLRSPWGIDLSPLVFARSGLPFNITTGRDTNSDTLFLERPAFATDLTKPTVVVTRFGAFDLAPAPGDPIIPRNFGNGHSFFSVNLSVSKTFSLGPDSISGATAASSHTGRGHGLIANALLNRRYAITASIQGENLLNHTNPGTPIGNLSSPLFGQSYSSAGAFGFGVNPAGNRRIQAQVTFAF